MNVNKEVNSKKIKKAIVVNLIGGPGVGKSIITSDLFSALKRKYVSCEVSPEYIKKKLREQALKAVQSQIYIFAKQQFQLFTLKDDVEVTVTDSPIILSAIYDKTECKFLRGLILKEFKKYKNLNFYIERDPSAEYEQEGRYQNLDGAKKVDEKIKKFLKKHGIKHTIINGIGEDSLQTVINEVNKILKKRNKK